VQTLCVPLTGSSGSSSAAGLSKGTFITFFPLVVRDFLKVLCGDEEFQKRTNKHLMKGAWPESTDTSISLLQDLCQKGDVIEVEFKQCSNSCILPV